VAQDRWLLLVDAAFANRALDPALPRLLQRDPETIAGAHDVAAERPERR